ncbi:ZIP family metal transporter [soil metagenome]
MNFPAVLILGAIAGVTIFLGIPIGRIKRPAIALRVVLSAIAVGVLFFLVWDVLSAAWSPIDELLASGDNPALLTGYAALFLGGMTVGLLAITFFQRLVTRKRVDAEGQEVELSARRLALFIAIGIGLHNFAEGLAIGQSAAIGEIGLAMIFVVGFALHNATEGFGIVAPMAGHETRPSWGFLLLLGVIGGGPTFIGTIVGWSFVSVPLSILFLALAAGSIIYVVIQLVGMLSKFKRADLVGCGVLAGLVAGFATDAILTAGGA